MITRYWNLRSSIEAGSTFSVSKSSPAVISTRLSESHRHAHSASSYFDLSLRIHTFSWRFSTRLCVIFKDTSNRFDCPSHRGHEAKCQTACTTRRKMGKPIMYHANITTSPFSQKKRKQ